MLWLLFGYHILFCHMMPSAYPHREYEPQEASRDGMKYCTLSAERYHFTIAIMTFAILEKNDFCPFLLTECMVKYL
jgi:hypothetical protein